MPTDVAESEDVRWERALDDLEASVLLAEGLLRGVTPDELAPWPAPALTTPLPAALADRARDLLHRQQELVARLPEAMDRIRRQRDVTQRIGAAFGSPRRASVYIDTTA